MTAKQQKTKAARDQMPKAMAEATYEQFEELSDEDREWLDMPPIGAEFGASEDD